MPPLAAAWGRDVSAAVAVGLVGISFYISAATLIFQGSLAAQLPAAIGAGLLGGGVLALLSALRTSLPLASVGPEPGAVPVIAAITVAAGSAAGPDAALPTAVAALAITGAVIGAAWWLMGRRGWGDLIRYVPYPVIGGFLASVGYLMLSGGLGVAMGQPFTWPRAIAWATGQADLRLAVALLIGVVVWLVTLRITHPLTLPVLLIGGACGIHGGLAAAGLDFDAARAAGWLMKPFARTLPVMPLGPELLAQVRWDAVFAQAGLMLSAVIVSAISLLLSDSSLEVAWDERADFNHDLKVLGQGNLLIAMIGGLAGGISISRSVLARVAGGVSRRAGAIKGSLCLLALGWGGPVIALIPRPLLGGLLVYLGIAMLKTWLFDSRKRLPMQEHLTIVVMLAITAVAGFLPAVAAGVLACCVDFAIHSSRLPPVRRLISRRAWPSKVERSRAQEEFLQKQGDRLLIAELQGVLFFGSATQLSRQIEGIVEPATRPQRLLLDFRHVSGLDTSAGQALARLFKAARRNGVQVELSQLDDTMRALLTSSGALAAGMPRVHPDIDTAISAWDDECLAQSGIGEAAFEAAIAKALPPGTSPAALLSYFEPIGLSTGELLFRQGDASDALYFVRSGRLTIAVPTAGGDVPVRGISPGGTVGEMGLLRQVPRTATARADVPCELLRLTRAQLERLEREHPELAAALYRVFMLQMSSRLDQLTMQANALARPA